MATPPSNASWDSEGNLLVPLNGIRMAMGLAFLAACAFLWFAYVSDQHWHQEHPGPGAGGLVLPQWMIVLRCALPLVPFALSALLLSTRSEQSKAAGAGIVAGLFPGALIFGILSVVALFLMSFYPNPYLWYELAAVIVFLPCCIWAVISAFRIAKGSWGVFWFTLVITVIFLTSGEHVLDAKTYQMDREHEQQKAQAAVELFTPVVQAQHTLASLAGCLILNQSLHPQSGYPTSLESPPPDWHCESKFAANAINKYTMSYAATTDANGVVADFHLVAMPLDTVRGHYPLMVDRRGIIFSDPMFGFSSQSAQAATSEARRSEIFELKRNIDSFMKENALVDAPASLNSQIVGTNFSSEVPHLEEDGQALSIKNYAFRYLTNKVGNRSRYAISSQCQSYGQDCLRSYFLDHDGVLHGTGEPRAATNDDPPALGCEQTDFECKDVVWPTM